MPFRVGSPGYFLHRCSASKFLLVHARTQLTRPMACTWTTPFFFDKLLRRRLSREEPASKGAGCGANPPLQEDLSGRHLLRSYVRGPTYIGGVLSGGESIWAELASKPTFTQLYDSTHRP